jgi:hypothetical protein
MVDVLKNREAAVPAAREEIRALAKAHPVPASFE